MGWVRQAINAYREDEISLEELALLFAQAGQEGRWVHQPRVVDELDDGPGVVVEDSINDITRALVLKQINEDEYRVLWAAVRAGYGM